MMVYEQALRSLIAMQEETGEAQEQINRYKNLVILHQQVYNAKAGLAIASAPGRVEIIGNHTDHNHGKVLAAAVNLDTVAAFTPREEAEAEAEEA